MSCLLGKHSIDCILAFISPFGESIVLGADINLRTLEFKLGCCRTGQPLASTGLEELGVEDMWLRWALETGGGSGTQHHFLTVGEPQKITHAQGWANPKCVENG